MIRHRAARLPAIPWINYLRVPAGLSGLLFLVWFPLILRLQTGYQASTTISPEPFLWHWLGVTGALFLLSAADVALRLRRTPDPAASPATASRDRPGDQGKRSAAGPPSSLDQEPHDPGHQS